MDQSPFCEATCTIYFRHPMTLLCYGFQSQGGPTIMKYFFLAFVLWFSVISDLIRTTFQDSPHARRELPLHAAVQGNLVGSSKKIQHTPSDMVTFYYIWGFRKIPGMYFNGNLYCVIFLVVVETSGVKPSQSKPHSCLAVLSLPKPVCSGVSLSTSVHDTLPGRST